MATSQSIVAVGTSSGGLAALKSLLQALPESFTTPIVITMHTGEESMLADLLAAASGLPVRHAVDKQEIRPAEVLVAPPGAHLLISQGRVKLGRGAKENYCRPAIDPMFRSVAYSYRERAVGVLLTGELDDGTVGLQAIKACGGIAIVQNPAEAQAPSMPSSALDYVDVDHCLPLVAIAQQLAHIEQADVRRTSTGISEALLLECSMDLDPTFATTEMMDKLAPRSALICPECQGVLWETQRSPLRYRCHTGHAFTAKTFARTQDNSIEEALWGAIRAVRDKEVFFNRRYLHAVERGRAVEASEYAMAAELARRNAEILVRLTTEDFRPADSP